MINLKGKTALITGSSRGIGLAIAEKLAALGANVILNGSSESVEKSGEKLKSQFKDIKVVAYAGDIASEAAVKDMYNQAVEEFPTIDIVVNNAGITKDNLLLRMNEADWDKVLDVNLKSVYLVCRNFIKPMLKQKNGRIINISSIVGEMGNAGQANYAASKAGMIGFTKSLARELAGKNITANVVAPGYIETEMTDSLSEAVKEGILAQIPLKRIGKKEDIANSVAFLASEEASYITGQVLSVNGGMKI